MRANENSNFLEGYQAAQRGESQVAIQHWERALTTETELADYLLFYMGREWLKSGECEKAAASWKQVLKNYPKSRWIAWISFPRKGEPCPRLREMTLQDPAVFCEKRSDPFRRAECLFEARRYAEALTLYQGLPKSLTLLTRISQSAARSANYEAALEANEEIRKLFPTRRASHEALEKIAYLYQISDRFPEAVATLQELVSKARSSSEKREYEKKLGWCYYRSQDFREAGELFFRLLLEREEPYLLYWKGKIDRQQGETESARALFKNLVERYPRHYYAYRALDELGPRWRRKTIRGWWKKFDPDWKTDKIARPGSDSLRRVDRLRQLGLRQEAEAELRFSRAQEGGDFPESLEGWRLRKGEVHFKKRVLTGDPAYPFPYAGWFYSQMERQALEADPNLLYAIMRQESHFDSGAVSRTQAMGLLQLVPLTGQRMAVKLGWKEFRKDWLLDPMTNIELAMVYFRELEQLFESRSVWWIAAYNAGEEVVLKWLPYLGSLSEEEFIEEIPYDETKNYVMRIYENLQAYRAIYR